jgi:CO/xanthine dehydrogenase Mo-binding subunit
MISKERLIGQCQLRVDGREKVTGQTRYAADLKVPGMIYGRILFSRFPHARILAIDCTRARAVPGVQAVLTAADLPNLRPFGIVMPDQEVIVGHKARYLGDVVALVAADTLEAAEEALLGIEVQYQPLPAVFSPQEALADSAPSIHEDRPDNIVNHHKLRKGDVSLGFAEADVILERDYRTPSVEHAYLEPEAVTAIFHQDQLELIGSIQNPFSTQSMVAQALGLPSEQIRVRQTPLGGSFGGKDEVMYLMAARAALLAKATQRPVRMQHSREESFRESYKRHPYQMRYKVGATREGRLTAMEITILADAGAYAASSPFVTWRSIVHATGPYRIEHVKTDITAVYTNNIYTGAMRGFGAPQVIFAVESLMDELAQELNLRPDELRRRNLLAAETVTATGQCLDDHPVSLPEVMDRALQSIGYAEKFKQPTPVGTTKRRGIGFAVSHRGCSLGAEGVDRAEAWLRWQADGTVLLSIGLSDNGAGLNTVLQQIAAEELGIGMEQVRMDEPDTMLVPDAGPTVASRGTLMGGNAVRQAAMRLREMLLLSASQLLSLPADQLSFVEGEVCSNLDPSQAVSPADVVRWLAGSGKSLEASGTYQAPTVDWHEETGQGRAYFTYVYGCQAAEVEVDLATGQVRVLHLVAAHELGRAINPATAKGQIYGGVAMGLGYGLLEELDLHQGQVRSNNLDRYLLPTTCDVPIVVTPILIENPDPVGPYGAKSLGEPTNELTAAAIANAISQATGFRLRELPCDLEKIVLSRPLKPD